MHWVIQNNLYRELGYEDLLRAMDLYRLPHTLVKVIPFGGGMEPDINPENPVIVMGSITFDERVVGFDSFQTGWGYIITL